MGRRKKNDVFVIGGEQLAAETQDLRQPEIDPASDRQEPAGDPPPGLGDPPHEGRSRSARWLAALGIAAVTAATLGALELSSSGDSEEPRRDQTSARSALVKGPAPSAAARPAPATPPSSPSRRDTKPGRSRSTRHGRDGESERELDPNGA